MTQPHSTPLKPLTELEQVVYFHHRERRRSFVGLPDLNRTHRYDIPTATIPAAAFPAADRDRLFSIRTKIRITNGALAAGLIFAYGNAATAIALFVDQSAGDGFIAFRAGDDGANAAIATWQNIGPWPDTLLLDLVCAVRPGDGRVRIWENGFEVARKTSPGGQLANGWAAAADGSYAAAAAGPLPSDVTETGAPTGFEVIETFAGYVGQVPQQFVGF